MITNFSALDGLALPVRDVAVDAAGAAWLATDGGLFRIGSQGGQVQGVVQDTTGRPVMRADVGVPGTPFQTVTDVAGQFVLTNLPSGLPQLRIDGQLAIGGPFTTACADLRAPGRAQNLGGTAGEQRVEPVALAPLAVSGPLNLVQISENGQTGRIGSQISLEVAVVDAEGNPVAGLPVTFTVLNGPGRVLPACVSTDPTGQAATTLTVTEAGAIRVEARVAGMAVILSATGGRDEGMARLRIVAGNNQIGAPGTVLPEPLVVRLEDQFGMPLPGVMTTAEVIQGEAAIVSPAQVATDAQGEASFVLRAGESEEIIVTRVSVLDQDVQLQSLIVALARPTAIAVEANGSLVVVDREFAAVVRVSPGTGDVSLVAGLGRGTGPPLVFPEDIAVETDGSLVVADGGAVDGGAVVRVNPATGDRTVLSGCAAFDFETFSCTAPIGTGPLLDVPGGIAVEADGSLVVADGGEEGQ